MLTIVWLAKWYWPEVSDAGFYGYRCAMVVGPWMILWGINPDYKFDNEEPQ